MPAVTQVTPHLSKLWVKRRNKPNLRVPVPRQCLIDRLNRKQGVDGSSPSEGFSFTCAIVRTNTSRSEWQQLLPNVRYEPTCKS